MTRVEVTPSPSIRKRLKSRLNSVFKAQPQTEVIPRLSSSPPQDQSPLSTSLQPSHLPDSTPLWSKTLTEKDPVRIGPPLPQIQSFFFKLPAEIRDIVYQNVFGPSLIHIEALSNRLAHVRCLEWQPDDGWDGHQHGIRGTGDEDCSILNKAEAPNDRLLAICLSCRSM